MNNTDVQEKIIELERQISALPMGGITKKNIRNGVYYYHRITVNGKRKEIYLNPEEAAELKEQIEHRKELEKELRELKAFLPKEYFHSKDLVLREEENSFRTDIRIGDMLEKYVSGVKKYKKRDCYDNLTNYLADTTTEKVMILYGLRRTGKTTLIRQAIADMPKKDRSRAAFIQIKSSDTLADVNADLKKLEATGYRYVFIDEVTLMKDFIEGAALFSDIFAASGMKIVLSGTDSLGFIFSEDEQLFDRCVLIHTTFIPYKEFERVLGITGIDEYIRYGGTMSLSGVNYNEDSVFSSSKRAGDYIDSAIAKNIQHSLQYYHDGNHFRSLRELYEKNELTGAINRVIEDMNHRFTVDILKLLEILNKEEQYVDINDVHAAEIKEYLKLLDLVVDIDVKYIPYANQNETMSVITQPGMRYVQAENLVESIVTDKTFGELDINERTCVLERIRNEIKGRLMEEIVLLETKLANPRKQVFKLRFAVGEFDMVVCDPETLTCRIFEIKHSREVVADQYRHLTDEQKCAETERQFGRIMGKYVIYRGESLVENGIEYIGVEEYLKNGK